MKWIAVILSFYFAALTVKPCVDASKPDTSAVRTFVSADNHTSHTADLCSPFCSCACCGVHIYHNVPVLPFQEQVTSKNISTLTPSYKSVFASNYYGSIWQPPQLA